MPRVYVTRKIPPTGLDLLRQSCDVYVWDGELPTPRDVLLEEAAQADAILTMLSDRIDSALLDAAPNLKVVSNYAVGFDNIDVAGATERGIAVGNTPGVLTDATADHAFAMMLAAARRLGEAERYVHQGEWKTWHPTKLLGQDVFGATLGVVGFGRIGQAMARRATGFNMRILYTGGSSAGAVAAELGAEAVELETLLRESDFISLHVPLTPDTKGLLGVDAFKMMKETAILVNTARGGVVDSAALVTALQEGQIAYAALDVTDPEPIPMDNPLLTLDNCLIVPHLGSATTTTRDRMGVIAAENILAGLKGETLPFCVNPEVFEDES
ncbi:D-glycerate dehydrogenase [Phototrophicus methaneseepsis]|uniref:Glyoxylate/hydroxypyruvate reductase B n=1 Tax=Phototrophicus methaneseepsis TaxID=2710758 RepID=A0A7S8E8H4_9CHLR|nr:D-glycerate dehydrogenase [Phototrophicus methaneseepsis]QPC82295.1 D-glycerate dehydrogenase [Phototrophicus methaneseepsis]